MSSHHFVKEQQEPALLILETTDIKFKQVADLLEWAPSVIVTQNTVFKALSWGIKVDLILADPTFQSGNQQLLEEQYPVKFLSSPKESFLQSGLNYLVSSGHHAVNIIQWDHQKAGHLEAYLGTLDLVFFDGPIRYFPAKNGQINKWFPKGPIQLHGEEGQFIEIQMADRSEVISLKHATFIELEEGGVWLKSNRIFWVGAFF
ncbi:MAG: thiamine pyrophosphokinase [Cyclobacteriaceae bacterium]